MKKEADQLAELKRDKRAARLLRDADAAAHGVKVRVARLRKALRAPALRPAEEVGAIVSAKDSVVTKGLLALYNSRQSMRTDDPRYQTAASRAAAAKKRAKSEAQLALPPLETPPKTPDAPLRARQVRSFSRICVWELMPEHAAASLFANAFRKKKAREALSDARSGSPWVLALLSSFERTRRGRRRGRSTSRPRRRRDSAEYPRRGRGGAETRLCVRSTSPSPRLFPTDYPRRGRGAAATRLHGISTWLPRRRRDAPPRNIHVAAAAPPRLVSA